MDRYWYRHKALLQAAIDEHGSVAAAARHFGVPPTTISHHARRLGVTSSHPRALPTATEHASKHGGCTYIIEAVGERLYKIGRTGGDPQARLARLRTMSPTPLDLVMVLDHQRWEDVLHHHFRDKRRHGEWFALTHSDLAELAVWSASY
jgi:hypothetical protein